MNEDLKTTPLNDLHIELGGRMVPFAGYDMPVQYAPGVMKEHLHCREHAGVFDVSHMGQIILHPRSGNVADAARALESLLPQDVLALKGGRQRYGFFTNADGGILDDLMIANRGGHLFLVVNAACKEDDIAHLRDHLSDICQIDEITDRALIALQGPDAEAVLTRIAPGVDAMRFMDAATHDSEFGPLWISRSGYTGEDGFEVSVASDRAEDFARALLADDRVQPIGLGARDSLRLEAGLCLYGNDIDTTTTPVEADLIWGMQKARRAGGDRAGGFPGADTILRQIADGPDRLRVGLMPDGRAPMREGTELFAAEDADQPVGRITSGAFGPSIARPMAMGYVAIDQSATGSKLWGEVRAKRLPVTVSETPFRPATYKR